MRSILTLTCLLLMGAASMLIIGCGDTTVQPTSTTTIIEGPPTITSITPTNGSIGDQVTIKGTNFAVNRKGRALTSVVTSVQFSGSSTTSYSVLDANTILTAVPSDAITGPITVMTQFGPATSPVFTVTTPAVIATPQPYNPNNPAPTGPIVTPPPGGPTPIISVNPTTAGLILSLAPPTGGQWSVVNSANATATVSQMVNGVSSPLAGGLAVQTAANGSLQATGSMFLPAGTFTMTVPSFKLTSTQNSLRKRTVLPGSTLTVTNYTMEFTVNTSGTWTLPVKNTLALSQQPDGSYQLGGTFGSATWNPSLKSVLPATPGVITLLLNPGLWTQATAVQTASVSGNTATWLGHSTIPFNSVSIDIYLQ